jgi:protein-S-isoprenylcysteine O-methyltransferase Ste14
MYGGGVVAAIGWGLVMASLPALAGAIALAVFVDLKARREEAWLTEAFDGYAAYSARTRRLIPWIY